MKQHTKRVGIIGLGIMGSIIAKALVQAGHEVVGYDPMPAARARLRRSGGRALASGTKVAQQADALICSLPCTAALHAVVADLQQAGRPKAGQIVIETSTCRWPISSQRQPRYASRGVNRGQIRINATGAD